MPDSRVQQLKRAWERSGAVADALAYLREQVRIGVLTEGRFELFAYCHQDPADGRAWFAGLRRWGLEVQAIAAFEATLACAEVRPLSPAGEAQLRELEATRQGGPEDVFVSRELVGASLLNVLDSPSDRVVLETAFSFTGQSQDDNPNDDRPHYLRAVDAALGIVDAAALKARVAAALSQEVLQRR